MQDKELQPYIERLAKLTETERTIRLDVEWARVELQRKIEDIVNRNRAEAEELATRATEDEGYLSVPESGKRRASLDAEVLPRRKKGKKKKRNPVVLDDASDAAVSGGEDVVPFAAPAVMSASSIISSPTSTSSSSSVVLLSATAATAATAASATTAASAASPATPAIVVLPDSVAPKSVARFRKNVGISQKPVTTKTLAESLEAAVAEPNIDVPDPDDDVSTEAVSGMPDAPVPETEEEITERVTLSIAAKAVTHYFEHPIKRGRRLNGSLDAFELVKKFNNGVTLTDGEKKLLIDVSHRTQSMTRGQSSQ